MAGVGDTPSGQPLGRARRHRRGWAARRWGASSAAEAEAQPATPRERGGPHTTAVTAAHREGPRLRPPRAPSSRDSAAPRAARAASPGPRTRAELLPRSDRLAPPSLWHVACPPRQGTKASCSLLFRTNAWGGEERETGERALPRALRLLPGSLHIYVYSRDAWGPPPGPPRSAVPELLLILETPAQSRQPWGPSVASASHPPVRTPLGRVGGVYTCPSPVDSHLLGRGGCGFRTTYPNSSV